MNKKKLTPLGIVLIVLLLFILALGALLVYPALQALLPLSAQNLLSELSQFLHRFITDPETDTTSLNLPLAVEYLAVIVGACIGSALAWDKGLDIIGAVILGILTGFGGGIIRDMLISGANFYFIDTPIAVILSMLAAIAVFYFRRIFSHLEKSIFWLDTLAMALFAFVGAEKALLYGLNPFAAIMLGAITAFGGGFTRDVSLGEIPQVFKQGNYYAICGIAGAASYVFAYELGFIKPAAALMSTIIAVGLRWASLKYNWRTQAPVDYSQHLLKPIKRIMRYSDGVQEVQNDSEAAHLAEKNNPSQLIVIDKNQLLVVHDIDKSSDEDKDYSAEPYSAEPDADSDSNSPVSL